MTMKLQTLAVVIKADDDKIYQIALTEIEKDLVVNFIRNLHNGRIKVLEKDIKTIEIVTP